MSENTFTKPLEVLLIEDCYDDIFLMKELLKDSQTLINLNIVNDGEKAIDYLFKKNNFDKTITPDLIILDLNLPKVDGREVLNILKNNDQYKTIPIIVLTTSRSEEDINSAYFTNANCYITKPIDLQEFLKVLKTIEDFWFKIVRLPNRNT